MFAYAPHSRLGEMLPSARASSSPWPNRTGEERLDFRLWKLVVGTIPTLPSPDRPFINLKKGGYLAARQATAQSFRAKPVGDGPWLWPWLLT
jgi:hypothetical protein